MMDHNDYPDPTPPSEPHPDEINEVEARKITQETMKAIKAEKIGSQQLVSRPRAPKSSREVSEAIGTAADKSEEIFELLNQRQTGEDSELEESLERIDTFLETFDLRLARIEAKMGISDDD